MVKTDLVLDHCFRLGIDEVRTDASVVVDEMLLVVYSMHSMIASIAVSIRPTMMLMLSSQLLS